MTCNEDLSEKVGWGYSNGDMPGSRPHPHLLIPFLIPLLIVSVLWGCSPEPPSPTSQGSNASLASGGGSPADQPPVIRIARIFPVDVTLDTTLGVAVQSEDLGGGRVTHLYQWYVNGVRIPGATAPQFVVERLKKGDRVTVDVTPNNGKRDGAVYRADPVTVGNTAPEIAEIFLGLVPLHRGDLLKVTVNTGDAEGEPITLSYKWLRNDKEIPGAKSETLDTKDFRKKDVLIVLVTVSDGKATREPRASRPVTIENAPPRFTSTPPAGITLTPVKEGPPKEGVYEYTVTVVDPDDDPVTFELAQGPPGMTIDAATGKIMWKVTLESLGKHHIIIAAKDNDKGVTRQEFDLELLSAPPQAAQQ